MRRVTAEEVQSGRATLIDVREYPEFVSGAIQHSRLIPLAELGAAAAGWSKNDPLVTICKSGRRAAQAAETLLSMGFADVAVLEGGIDAWKRRGLPLEVAERRPWSIERQVRVAAGSLIVTFSALGVAVSPKFFAGAAAVGAGLVFAGVSDTCMMGSALGKMPWNRAPQRLAAIKP